MGKKGDKQISQADKYRKQLRKREKLKNKEKRKLNREISHLNTSDPDRVGQVLAKLQEKEFALDTRLKQKKFALQKEAAVLIKKKVGVPTLQEYEEAMTMESRKTLEELEKENLEKFPNPEESPYYHPTLNPFGVAPPDAPALPTVSGLKSTLLLNAPLPKPLTITSNGEVEKPSEEPTELMIKELQQKFKDDVLEEVRETEIDLSSIPLPTDVPIPQNFPSRFKLAIPKV